MNLNTQIALAYVWARAIVPERIAKMKLDRDIAILLNEGRGIAAGFIKGYRENRPGNDESAIGEAVTAGYNARALYLPETFDVIRAALAYARMN